MRKCCSLLQAGFGQGCDVAPPQACVCTVRACELQMRKHRQHELCFHYFHERANVAMICLFRTLRDPPRESTVGNTLSWLIDGLVSNGIDI